MALVRVGCGRTLDIGSANANGSFQLSKATGDSRVKSFSLGWIAVFSAAIGTTRGTTRPDEFDSKLDGAIPVL